MKVTRLYTGEDQQSHFHDIQLELNPSVFGKITVPTESQNIVFGEIEGPNEISWHNPPCAQYVVMLKGSVEIEIGDGSKRLFNEGDIILAEDITGQGHVTRGIGEGVRRYLVVPLR
ncbi:MAG TPA: hypothetical protein VGV92_07565 [Gammaproteobacteria bacterium]|nr:hypothetical protein [Gammaproteobacteria bacterium]